MKGSAVRIRASASFFEPEPAWAAHWAGAFAAGSRLRHMGLLQRWRDRRATHRQHLLEHELRREQAHSGIAPSATGAAGPLLGGRVGEVESVGSDHPLAARDEEVDESR